jgi:C-terminal processing protease CtpA/Prc
MSSGNIVHYNIIKSPTNSGIQVNTRAAGNTFFHNTIIDAPAKRAIVTDTDIINEIDSKKQAGIEIDDKNTSQNRFSDNIVTAKSM